MAAWTLSTAQDKLAMWMAAEDAVSQGQSYEIDVGGNKRRLTRADLETILKMINFWRREVERLSSGQGGGGIQIKYVNPVS